MTPEIDKMAKLRAAATTYLAATEHLSKVITGLGTITGGTPDHEELKCSLSAAAGVFNRMLMAKATRSAVRKVSP